jgi:hypothetical protein
MVTINQIDCLLQATPIKAFSGLKMPRFRDFQAFGASSSSALIDRNIRYRQQKSKPMGRLSVTAYIARARSRLSRPLSSGESRNVAHRKIH